MMAFGESYGVLLAARFVQGVGSAFSACAALAMVADAYPEDESRSQAVANAMIGVALGVLTGPPFGGLCYHYLGRRAPFYFVIGFVCIDATLRVLVVPPESDSHKTDFDKENEDHQLLLESSAQLQASAPIWCVLRDPYVLCILGLGLLPNMSIALIEPTLPVYLKNEFGVNSRTFGLLFIASTVRFKSERKRERERERKRKNNRRIRRRRTEEKRKRKKKKKKKKKKRKKRKNKEE